MTKFSISTLLVMFAFKAQAAGQVHHNVVQDQGICQVLLAQASMAELDQDDVLTNPLFKKFGGDAVTLPQEVTGLKEPHIFWSLTPATDPVTVSITAVHPETPRGFQFGLGDRLYMVSFGFNLQPQNSFGQSDEVISAFLTKMGTSINAVVQQDPVLKKIFKVQGEDFAVTNYGAALVKDRPMAAMTVAILDYDLGKYDLPQFIAALREAARRLRTQDKSTN